MTEEEKSGIELVEVPTEYGLGFKDNSTGKVLDTNQLLEKIANDLEEIKKATI